MAALPFHGLGAGRKRGPGGLSRRPASVIVQSSCKAGRSQRAMHYECVLDPGQRLSWSALRSPSVMARG
jgi:hypothetical protein